MINSLVQGGAQRACLRVLEGLEERGVDVTLATFYPEGTDFFDASNLKSVIRFDQGFFELGTHPAITSSFQRLKNEVRRLRRRLKDWYALHRFINKSKFDVIVAFESYTGALVISTNLNKMKNIIVAERVHPQFHKIPIYLDLIRRISYRWLGVRVTAQDVTIAKYLQKYYGAKSVAIIPNIVEVSRAQKDLGNIEKLPDKRIKVVALSRYHWQKGIDVLLKAWSAIPSDMRKNMELNVYGDGDRREYMSLANSLELKDVYLNGRISDTETILRQSDIFVLTSRYEGFSNSLTEAMSMGLACIATDCPGANSEISGDGKYALLVPMNSELELCQAIIELSQDYERRSLLGASARSSMMRFDKEIVLSMWQDALNSMVDSKTH